MLRTAIVSANPVQIPMPWIVAGAITLVAALLGAGWIGTLIQSRSDRRKRRDEISTASTEEALARLRDLRAAYRQCALNAPAQPDTFERAQLADQFDSAACMTLSSRVMETAREYVRVGKTYASRDPFVSQEHEQDAYLAVTDCLVVNLKSNR